MLHLKFLLRLALVLLLGLGPVISPSFSQQVIEQPKNSLQATPLLLSIETKLLEAQKQLAICQQLLKDRSLTSVAYETKLQELEATITDLTQQINNLKQIRDNLQNKVDTSETIITNLNNKIETLESQLTQLKGQLAALSTTFELYKKTNDKIVNNLELASGGYKIAAITLGFTSLTAGGYIISGNKWEGAVVGVATATALWGLGHFVFHLW